MSQPKVAIAITADDRTAKGWASAEKRAAGGVKRLGKNAEQAASGISRGGSGLLSTFSKVEQAASRLMGGKSITSGITGRLGQLGEVAGEARVGMLGAAEAGGVLEGAMVGMAGAAAATVGVVAAAAVGMYKLADGWGKGANQLGNMASLLGVSTKGLQEFAGAAERVGVSKEAANGAIGGLSQTLNDARYGRNTGALAVLGKMGVTLQTNQDGTVNVEAMLPVIADALKSQNSSGRRTAAKALGIPEAALAAFTQGSKPLGADMADFGQNGAVISDDDTKLGRQLTHRDVSGEQRIGKAWLSVQRANAGIVKGAGDFAIDTYNGGISAPSLIGSADAETWGANAGSGFAQDRAQRGPKWRGGGRMSATEVARHARHARGQFAKYVGQGMSPSEAAAWAANAEAESGGDAHRQQPGGQGYGLYQWGAKDPRHDRRLGFKRAMGRSIYGSSEADQDRFRVYELEHDEARARREIELAQGAGNKAAVITTAYERPGAPRQDAADRANIAEQIIKLEIEFKNPPAGGVSAKAAAGSGAQPAVSFAFSPVRGG